MKKCEGICFPRVIILIIAVLGFLLLQPDHPLLSSGDDDDYFSVSTAIAYGKFPHFLNEYHEGEKMPVASVGPGVLASPFVLAFSMIDRFEGAPIVKQRTKENRYWTWTLVGFEIAAYFYALLGVLLLFEALKHWGKEQSAFLVTLLVALGGGGLLIYVFRRPLMSHAFEFFTICSGIFLITLALKQYSIRFHAVLMGLCASFILLTRYNNLFLGLGLMLVYLHTRYSHADKNHEFIIMLLAFLLPIFLFKLLPILCNGYSAFDQQYGGVAKHLLPTFNVAFYFQRIKDIWFGLDMGLIFTAPVFFMGLLAIWSRRHFLPKEWLFLNAFSSINFYIAILWKSFGSYYGYRYLVFTAIPLMSVFLVSYVDTLWHRIGKVKLMILCFVLIYIPLMSMFVFEASQKYLFFKAANAYGKETYFNPAFHQLLLQDLLHSPFRPLGHGIKRWFVTHLSGEILTQRLILCTLPPLFFYCYYAKLRAFFIRKCPCNS